MFDSLKLEWLWYQRLNWKYIYILILLKSAGHTYVKFISYNVDLIQMIGYITVVYKEVYIKMQSEELFI